MIVKLMEEIKKGFSVSESNQVSIKEACEILETKFDLLAKRTQVLEDRVESLKEDVALIKQDLRQSKVSEQELQDKLERLENAARRNNLRILNIPEGAEGDDIKSSDLARSTLNRQWELGNRLEDFKKLGASSQLKFPAFLRVMYNNKNYNITDNTSRKDIRRCYRLRGDKTLFRMGIARFCALLLLRSGSLEIGI
ncbi:hypothetical protein NDU88_001856 [Pleurodeles waltl]|uniref:Uncharacterized protein n=1 Tax=Pleurodeles waltl TaxID=8319 RepID=A0AAV7LMS7_PLEWA|nr:hypothetical protein NDU88_001856 [Pleurodeles waltl]